jgi:hypothetical protein
MLVRLGDNGDTTKAMIEALRKVIKRMSRIDRWIKAEGGARDLAVVRLSSRDGCYVLFAAAVSV